MANTDDLRVLIVEDSPMTAEAHVDFVRRVPSFVVARLCDRGGDALGLLRVTVRRYLEHLVKTKQAVKQPRRGAPGRPEREYRWV